MYTRSGVRSSHVVPGAVCVCSSVAASVGVGWARCVLQSLLELQAVPPPCWRPVFGAFPVRARAVQHVWGTPAHSNATHERSVNI